MQKKLAYGTGWIAVLFLFLICFSVRVQAAPAVSAQSSPSSAKQGENIAVTVNLQGNEGISSALLMLNYDNASLKYVGSTWSSSVTASDTATASDLGSAVQLNLVSPAGYYGNGVLCTVNFQALKDVASPAFSLQAGDLIEIQAAASNTDETEDADWEDGEDSDWQDDSEEDSDWEEDADEADTWEADSEEEETVTNGWRDDTAWNSQDKSKSNKASATETDTTAEAEDGTSVIQSMLDAWNPDWGTASTEPETAAASTEAETETATVQPAKNTTVSAGTRTSSSSRADRTYKTGVGLGNDIFLILFAATAVAALLILVRRNKMK